MAMSYPIPAAPVMDEQIIKKSRFITLIQHVKDKKQAVALVQQSKALYPDARHHCWAYIAGHPTATTAIGCSDDGEPQGTAGKPILNVLQHRGIGEIGLVVVRYFGGIKLGAGGLVRAYSSSAHLAVEKLKTTMHTEKKTLEIAFAYDIERHIQHLLQEKNIAISQADYRERIVYRIDVPIEQIAHIKQDLTNVTSGRCFWL